jgi:membrane-associated phospholipid phosphatase
MAITFLIAFVAWRHHPAIGVLGWLYAASMAFALVYLGEHYVADLLAGLVVAAMAWRASDIWRWFRRGELEQQTNEAVAQPIVIDVTRRP